MRGFNIGIVGATGLLGKELIRLLEKESVNRTLPINHLFLFASEQSENTKILFKGEFLNVENIKTDSLADKDLQASDLIRKSFKNLDLIFFTAGAAVSEKLIPLIDRSQTVIIDASSAFRLQKDVPLVIFDINAYELESHDNLIASANNTALIMLTALFPLYKAFKIRRTVVSTYQCAGGGGEKLLQKLQKDTDRYFTSSQKENHFYGYNLFLHESGYGNMHNSFSETGFDKYNLEELKLIKEPRKVLEAPNLQVAPTCVRVPVMRSHAMSLNIQLKKKTELKKALQVLHKARGIKIVEDFAGNEFATPLTAVEQEKTLVGRIRLDQTQENTLEMWAAGDQLLKGALNLLQIAEFVLKGKKPVQKPAEEVKDSLALVTG